MGQKKNCSLEAIIIIIVDPDSSQSPSFAAKMIDRGAEFPDAAFAEKLGVTCWINGYSYSELQL